MLQKRLFGALLALSLTAAPMISMSAMADGIVNLGSTPSYNATTGQYETSYDSNSSMQLRGRVSTIPKGTNMMIKVDQPISSFSSNLGDPISATLENDLFINDSIAIPAGSEVIGQVANVSPSGRAGKHGEIDIRFFSVKTPDGVVVPIRGHVVTKDNTGVLKGNSYAVDIAKGVGLAAGTTGIGAVGGTALGGILGVAGAGAVMGTALGGVGGIAYALARKGKDVVIPSGARMSIVVDQPVSVNM